MARVVALLLAATLLAAGRPGHAAPSSAEVFWRAVLPDSAVPDAVRNAVTFNYNDYKLSSPAPDGRARADSPFLYYYKAPSERLERTEARDHSPFSYDYKAPGGAAASTEEGERAATATATVFFHEQAVRVAEILPFHFPPAAPAALGFLTRRAADSIPFSTPALPGVLAMLGVPPDSDQAAAMAETLRTCESPTTSGEVTFCATSLEAVVERAMAALGTRDVRAVTSTLPRGGAPLQRYTVRAVRPVEGSSFVACHDEAYPYTVYRCHGTGPARAYMVEIEGGRGGDTVTMATVCHSDTSLWNPEHMSFKLLGTKPGGEPICHLMPYGHILWAKNVKTSPA